MAVMSCKTCKNCNGTGCEVDQVVLGRAMRNRRLGAMVPLRAMASCMGISHTYLSHLEAGHRKWSPSLVRRFEESFKQQTK